MRSVLFRAAALAAAVLVLVVAPSTRALASPGSGGNCAFCHDTPGTNRETTTPTTINALPGDLVAFTMNVTNGADASSVAFTGKTVNAANRSGVQTITAITGTANAANILNVPLSAGWTSRTRDGVSYYTNDGSGTVYSKTFSFTVPAGTPADTYSLVMKVAGVDANMWSQATPISLVVGDPVPEPATLAMLSGGALVGFICWRGRRQLAAK